MDGKALDAWGVLVKVDQAGLVAACQSKYAFTAIEINTDWKVQSWRRQCSKDVN
jgi:hypothetical protein